MATPDSEALRIFREILDQDPTARNRAFDEACGDDEALRTRVRRLIEADAGGPDLAWIVEREAGEVAREMAEDVAEDETDLSGRRIGRYRIVRRIGTGGMGTVYEAEQDEPRRRVAVKTLRLGVDSRDALARFKLEAQVLARMSHPGIATVLEAGRHEGVPYFAMEFVDGARPLTTYAAEEHLDDEARIDLFLRFCDAVAYGHARGVVHRDLKPQNLLVDREGTPKIIDFGVARAIEPMPDITVLPTSSGEIVGTLSYMSPEQLSGDPDLVDVQSDVYALGVVLFQLLTGERPKDARGLTLTEAIRVLAERDPRRLGAVRTDLPLELEWIVAKALESDRTRRYRTANDLADDLRRYLANEPVDAGPPSTAYRVRKFVRRHRVGVAVVALLMLSLVGGVVGTSLALVAERTQRQRLERMTEFQASIFGTMQAQSLGPDARMADVLDMAAARIDGELRDDPESRSELQRSFGTAYFALGRFEDARRMYEGALDVVLGKHGPGTVESVSIRMALASTLSALRDTDGAIALYEPLLVESRRGLGRLSTHTLRTAVLLAFALLDRRDAAQALTILERASEDLDEGMAAGHDYGNVPMMLCDGRARALSAMGDVEGALGVFRDAERTIAARFGDDLPDLANIRFNHGMTLKSNRRFAEARPLLADALRVMGPHLGASHPMVEMITVHLAEAIRLSEERVEEAIPLYVEAIRLKKERGDRPIAVYRMRQNLVSVHWTLGRFEDVDRLQSELAADVDRESPDLPFRWFVHQTRGEFLMQRERFAEAEQQFVLARELADRFADDREIDPNRAVLALADLYEKTGRESEAAALRAATEEESGDE